MFRLNPARRIHGAARHIILSDIASSQFTRRGFTSSIPRSQQPQPPQLEKSNTFKEGISAYRPFGAPFLKVFLGAIFTYQVIYYAWMKLETSEKKFLKNGLEKEAKKLAAEAKS
ncbi:conserved hypothetical protein [Talaromyces stipitatus ATCC 10500]|uniref:Uncharacterized protein n=1 Tax=Talaromyces stipitatus (strain ATCC 10500 / CBS 375.48 / QM 6759 / NRRL 1006) TaxID=441959 RepID=B8MHN5_TALSN|nr:uncharacterized protein TSTA_011250 [Talaromyces stipitatus ATCC 10500]EED16016.1 conserved hypothetical protein [Talaromyces stipitatus ATCC 10500]